MKVLLCLDGSTASERGIPTCQEFANALGAEVEIVRAVLRPHMNWGEPHTGTLGIPQFVRDSFARQDAEIAERLNAIAATFPVAHMKLLHGHEPGEEIIREALEQQVDMIVMTSHDTGLTGHVKLGSVVRQVIESGVAPVLIVHPDLGPPLSKLPIGARVFTADGQDIGELTEVTEERLRVRASSGEALWLHAADVDRLEIGHLVLHWDSSATAERVLIAGQAAAQSASREAIER